MKYVILVITVFLIGCTNDNDPFLDKFATKREFDGVYFKRKAKIEIADLKILVKTDEQNKFVFNTNPKYYYGYKIKLDDNHYLLNYFMDYVPIYRPINSIYGWTDSFLCIYDVNEKCVTSKIRIWSTDPILSGCEKTGDIYEVKSSIISYNFSEKSVENKFVHKHNVSKYKIVNDRFEEISNEMADSIW